MWVQVGGEGFVVEAGVFRWGGGGGVGLVQWGGGAKGRTLGGLNGSKGANVGGGGRGQRNLFAI